MVRCFAMHAWSFSGWSWQNGSTGHMQIEMMFKHRVMGAGEGEGGGGAQTSPYSVLKALFRAYLGSPPPPAPSPHDRGYVRDLPGVFLCYPILERGHPDFSEILECSGHVYGPLP